MDYLHDSVLHLRREGCSVLAPAVVSAGVVSRLVVLPKVSTRIPEAIATTSILPVESVRHRVAVTARGPRLMAGALGRDLYWMRFICLIGGLLVFLGGDGYCVCVGCF